MRLEVLLAGILHKIQALIILFVLWSCFFLSFSCGMHQLGELAELQEVRNALNREEKVVEVKARLKEGVLGENLALINKALEMALELGCQEDKEVCSCQRGGWTAVACFFFNPGGWLWSWFNEAVGGACVLEEGCLVVCLSDEDISPRSSVPNVESITSHCSFFLGVVVCFFFFSVGVWCVLLVGMKVVAAQAVQKRLTTCEEARSKCLATQRAVSVKMQSKSGVTRSASTYTLVLS